MTRRATDDDVLVRRVAAADADAIRALVLHESSGSAYAVGPRYFLDRALGGQEDNARCLVAEREAALIACLLFGNVAGTVGTGRLHYIVVSPHERRRGIGSALCNTAVATLISDGARRVVVEMPDDDALAPARKLLAACHFDEIASVADYYRDHVPLVILERRLTSA